MIRFLLLGLLLLTGCAALGPGMHMDEKRFHERHEGKARDGEGE